MPSGSFSVGGTCTDPSLTGAVGIAPVMSLGLIGIVACGEMGITACGGMGITAWGGMVTGMIWGAGACGIATCALSSVLGVEPLFDCLPIGAGEIIEGAAGS